MADETAVIDPPAPSPTPAGKTPMSAIFDRAADRAETQTPVETPPAPPEPKPDAPPTKPPATKDAPPAVLTEFTPPDVLLGEPTKDEPPPKEPSVVDLMPEEPPVSIRTKKDQENYKIWRGHQQKLETENKDLKEKLGKQPAPDVNAQAQIEQLQNRLLEMSSVVERADLMSHPAVQNQFVKPRKAAFDEATEVLKEVELDPKLLDRIFNSSGKDRTSAKDDLIEQITSPSARIKVIELVSEIERKDQEMAAAMSDIKGTHERIQLEDRATRHRQMQEDVKQLNAMVDVAVEGLRDKAGFELLKKIDGNDKWNTVVDEMVSTARNLLTNNTDPQQIAAAAVLAPMAIKYRTWALNESKRRVAAEKELAEYKSADPSLEGKPKIEGGEEEPTGMAAIFRRAADGNVFGSS